MARYNAIDEQFTEVTVLGKPALFHDMRIDRESVPKGLFLLKYGMTTWGTQSRYRLQRGLW